MTSSLKKQLSVFNPYQINHRKTGKYWTNFGIIYLIVSLVILFCVTIPPTVFYLIYTEQTGFNSGGEALIDIAKVDHPDPLHPEYLILKSYYSELDVKDFAPSNEIHEYNIGDILYIPLWQRSGDGILGFPAVWDSGGSPFCQNRFPYKEIPEHEDCPDGKFGGAHAFLKGIVVDKTTDANLKIRYGFEDYIIPEQRVSREQGDKEFDFSNRLITALLAIDPEGNGLIKQLCVNGKKFPQDYR